MLVYQSAWTTALSGLLSLPVIGIVAHRNLQRWQVVACLTPPVKPPQSKEEARKQRLVNHVATVLGLVVSALLVVLIMSVMYSKPLADTLFAVFLAITVFAVCTILYQALCAPDEWSLTLGLSSQKTYLFKNTASDNTPQVVYAICIGLGILTVVGGYVNTQATICTLSIVWLAANLLRPLQVVVMRKAVLCILGWFAALFIWISFIVTLLAFIPDGTPTDSESIKEPKEVVFSVFMSTLVSFFSLAYFHAISAFIVTLNLRYDHSRAAHGETIRASAEPLPAGESAPIAPLLPFKPIVSNPRLFRSSFIALVSTYAVLYTVFAFTIPEEYSAVWVPLASAAGSVAVIATSAIHAHRLGELRTWWNYREVWLPNIATDVEQNAVPKDDMPEDNMPEDQTPLLAAESK